MPRLLKASVFFLAFTSCCSYPSHARIRAGDQQLCAKHRVPLITAHGFTYGPYRIPLIHYKPYREFEKVDSCTPNRIDDLQSLRRHDDINKPALVVYCPRCEAEFQERWYGPVVTMGQLVGTWRNVKTGSVTTIGRDGRCRGIGYDGKPFMSTWRIIRRGLIETREGGDDYTFYHVITHIDTNSFVDRWDDGTDRFVRLD